MLAVGAITLTAAPLVAGQAANTGLIRACVVTSTGYVRILLNPLEVCRSTERAAQWNQTGPQGPAGPVGPAGPAGPPGPAAPADPGSDGKAIIGRITFGYPPPPSTSSVASAPQLVSDAAMPITGATFGVEARAAVDGFPPLPTDGHLFDFAVIEKPIGPMSARLLQDTAEGEAQRIVSIELCRTPDCAPEGKYFEYILTSVMIGSIHQGGADLGGTQLETLRLSFGQVEWTAYDKGVPAIRGCWSIRENRAC